MYFISAPIFWARSIKNASLELPSVKMPITISKVINLGGSLDKAGALCEAEILDGSALFSLTPKIITATATNAGMVAIRNSVLYPSLIIDSTINVMAGPSIAPAVSIARWKP